jgi:hypothetical protein
MTTENKNANIREYQIRAGLTDTFGRLICSTRHHHFVVDGPAVDAFKARCPLYGTLAVATPKVDVNVNTQI